jgi:ParB-like chromosome segregation protein Spo0J
MNIVCGDGRLEALVALGEKTIPAVIIETTREEMAQRAHTGGV